MAIYKVKDLIQEVISGEWGSEVNDESSGIKVIRTTNFSNIGKLNLNKEVVLRKIESDKVNKKRLMVGDTIIEKSGGSPEQPVGRVVFFEENELFLCNNFTSILRPNKELVEPKYLMYLLFNLYRQRKVLKFQNKTTGIINLKLDQYLNKTIVDIPAKEIQLKVVNALDQAFDLIEKRQSQIAALGELTKSVFLEMFGDPVLNLNNYADSKLSDLCLKITDGTHHSPPMVGKGVPYVSAKHLGKGYIDFFSNPAYISHEEHEKIYKRCDPVKGDVLYIKDGATTGIAGINHYDFEFSMLSSLALIKPDLNQLNNYYLVHYLNNSRIKDNILNNMSGGAIKRLTIKKINNLNIVVPPISLQNTFMESVVNIEKQKEKMNKGLEELKSLYASLLQKSFQGEVFQ